MACEICGRGSCTRSFHSLSEQERFDRGECEECAEAQAEITRLHAKVEELRGKYEELLFCVEQNHPNETRHETAKRLIKSAYNRTGGPCAALNDSKEENDG